MRAISQSRSVLLMLMLFTMNASASSWLECMGAITVKAVYQNSKNKKVLPGSNRSRVLDAYIHSDTFKCDGHSASMPTGLIKKTKFVLTSNVDITLKAEQRFRAKYEYVDGRSPEGIFSRTEWTLLAMENSANVITPEDSPLNIAAKRYYGHAFSIEYPSNFIPKPTPAKKDANRTINAVRTIPLPPRYVDTAPTDEAYFSSPEGLVEFLIYSPHPGIPKDYFTVKSNEELVSQHSKQLTPSKTKTWFTIREKKGNYFRSYMEEKNCRLNDDGSDTSECQTHVFGIKYKNKQAYDKYRNDYIKFKKSLEQYMPS